MAELSMFGDPLCPTLSLTEDEISHAEEEFNQANHLDITPSKVMAVFTLLQNQVLASPTRWGWICNMATELIVDRRGMGKVEKDLMAMLKVQSNLLESRAADSNLARLKAKLFSAQHAAKRCSARIKEAEEAQRFEPPPPALLC